MEKKGLALVPAAIVPFGFPDMNNGCLLTKALRLIIQLEAKRGSSLTNLVFEAAILLFPLVILGPAAPDYRPILRITTANLRARGIARFRSSHKAGGYVDEVTLDSSLHAALIHKC